MLLPSQISLWADKLQETEKTISNTTWSLQTGFEFRGGGAASSGKSSSLSLLLGRGWKMTHMHCGLDKNRPFHRSTNPARMRLNVWSMVITSCREQCPPPGLQQRADKAVSWWARVLVFCVLNFSCCATNERKHGMKSVPKLVMLQGGVCALCTPASQPAC